MRIVLFLIVLFSLIVRCEKLFSQDELLNALIEQPSSEKEKVIATFKGDKIINIETNETVGSKNLDFRVSHLFGNTGKKSGGGLHNFYGLDQSNDIRIAIHYGITDRLMLGVSRAKRNENLEGLMKFRLLEQTTDNSIPFAITLFGNTTYSLRSGTAFQKNIHRFNYFSQVIFSRKFSSRFSLIISPGFVHRNFVAADDENNTFSLSSGFRLKFTRSSSFVLDFSHTFGRADLQTSHFDVLGAGVEIETGGHVFSVMFSNASGILESDYLINTQDSWGDGGFKLSFIISRIFPFGKERREGK